MTGQALGQYDAFGIASLDVSHDDTVVSGVTVAVADGCAACSCAVVKRDPVMLENMRAQQRHAQARALISAPCLMRAICHAPRRL